MPGEPSLPHQPCQRDTGQSQYRKIAGANEPMRVGKLQNAFADVAHVQQYVSLCRYLPIITCKKKHLI